MPIKSVGMKLNNQLSLGKEKMTGHLTRLNEGKVVLKCKQ